MKLKVNCILIWFLIVLNTFPFLLLLLFALLLIMYWPDLSLFLPNLLNCMILRPGSLWLQRLMIWELKVTTPMRFQRSCLKPALIKGTTKIRVALS